MARYAQVKTWAATPIEPLDPADLLTEADAQALAINAIQDAAAAVPPAEPTSQFADACRLAHTQFARPSALCPVTLFAFGCGTSGGVDPWPPRAMCSMQATSDAQDVSASVGPIVVYHFRLPYRARLESLSTSAAVVAGSIAVPPDSLVAMPWAGSYTLDLWLPDTDASMLTAPIELVSWSQARGAAGMSPDGELHLLQRTDRFAAARSGNPRLTGVELPAGAAGRLVVQGTGKLDAIDDGAGDPGAKAIAGLYHLSVVANLAFEHLEVTP